MKMTEKDWDLINAVHVKGAFSVTRAAWNYMREAGYGRIIMTSSASGLYGNFGQANYSAAKLALVGFANTLAKEGEKRNIRVNTIAPIAASRMTKDLLPPDLFDVVKPEFIAPIVAWLCHEECQENGGVFELTGGWVAKVRWQRTEGAILDISKGVPSVAEVKKNWDKVGDWSNPTYPTGSQETITALVGRLQAKL